MSHIIKDEKNNVILEGGNLIPLGKEHLGMIGFVGGVFFPFILMFVLLLLSLELILDIIPILFFFGTLWAIGYMIFYNLLFNRFRFTYKFRDGNGNLFGELESDWTMTSWKISDPDGAVHAILRFSRTGMREFFTIDTPDGQYTAYCKSKGHLGGTKRLIGCQRFKEIEVTASNMILAFTLLNYGQVVKSEGVLSSLITLLTGTCVATRLHQVWLEPLFSPTTDKPTTDSTEYPLKKIIKS